MVFLTPNILGEKPLPEESTLDYAISMAGLSRSDIHIPTAWEAGYVVQGIFPAVNDILLNPFYLPPYSQLYGAYMNGYRGSITPSVQFRKTIEMIGCSLDGFQRGEIPRRSLMDVFEQMQIKAQRGFIPPAERKLLDTQILSLPIILEFTTVDPLQFCPAYFNSFQ